MKKLILKLIAVSAIIALPASSTIPTAGVPVPEGPGGAIIGPVLEFPEPCGIQGQRPCRADVVTASTASTVPMAGLEQAGPPSIYDPLGHCEAEHDGQSPCRNDLV